MPNDFNGIDHSNRAHAVLSASSAARWTKCTPSALLAEEVSKTIPRQDTSYSREGTLAHEFGDIRLRDNHGQLEHMEALKIGSELRKDPQFSQEMLKYVDVYCDYVSELMVGYTSDMAKKGTGEPILLVEESLDYSQWAPKGRGTGDACIIADSHADVIDLKFGKGIPVSAEENEQLKCYALGLLAKYEVAYDLETISMHIVQPRLDNISVFTLNVAALYDWAETVLKPKALEAMRGDGEFVAGEHCRFCPASPKCPKMMQAFEELDDLKDTPAKEVSKEDIIKVLKHGDVVATWVKRVNEYALSQALHNGVVYDGFKIVEGRSIRKWADEASAAKELIGAGVKEEDIYTKKIIGITAAEKLAGKANKDKLTPYIHKPMGAPKLAPNTSKSKLYKSEVNKQFDDLDK